MGIFFSGIPDPDFDPDSIFSGFLEFFESVAYIKHLCRKIFELCQIHSLWTGMYYITSPVCGRKLFTSTGALKGKKKLGSPICIQHCTIPFYGFVRTKSCRKHLVLMEFGIEIVKTTSVVRGPILDGLDRYFFRLKND